MPGPMTTCRRALATDAARIAAIHHVCWRQVFQELLDPSEFEKVQPRSALFEAWLGHDSGCVVFVATDAADVVLGYTVVRGPALLHLFVDPSCWHQGIGRTLLGIGEQYIAAAGHPQAELHTRVGNTRAINLYQAAGWKMTDQIVIDDDQGRTSPEHVMIKNFEAA